MYYLEKGMNQKWLGILFSLLVIPFAFVISCIVDTNTSATTLYDHFQMPILSICLLLAEVVGVIIFGGGKSIGYVCFLVAPFFHGWSLCDCGDGA